MRRLLMLPLILAAACAAKEPPKETPVRDPLDPLMMGPCEVSKAQFAVGQKANAALVEKIKAATGMPVVRQIKPGQKVAMNYSTGRVNLSLDEAGVVTKVTCG